MLDGVLVVNFKNEIIYINESVKRFLKGDVERFLEYV